jgi:hypothetical protein
MAYDTWYVLEDGSFADSRDVAIGTDGVLRHKDGVAVAMRSPGVPRSRGMSEDEKMVATKAREAAMAAKLGKATVNEARAETGKAPIASVPVQAPVIAKVDAPEDAKKADQAKRGGYQTREAKAE